MSEAIFSFVAKAARFIKTDGWLYFAIGCLPELARFCLSDVQKTFWVILGSLLSSLAAGLIALKAFRSKGKEEEK